MKEVKSNGLEEIIPEYVPEGTEQGRPVSVYAPLLVWRWCQ